MAVLVEVFAEEIEGATRCPCFDATRPKHVEIISSFHGALPARVIAIIILPKRREVTLTVHGALSVRVIATTTTTTLLRCAKSRCQFIVHL